MSQKEGERNVCRSHSSLQYCMALWPHLQATPFLSQQTHGLIDYGILFAIEFLSSPPALENKAGYDALRMASHNNHS